MTNNGIPEHLNIFNLNEKSVTLKSLVSIVTYGIEIMWKEIKLKRSYDSGSSKDMISDIFHRRPKTLKVTWRIR